MNDKIIELEKDLNAETIFFLGTSPNKIHDMLFSSCKNPYASKLNEKFILVEEELSKKLPNYCYLKINKVIDKPTCYMVTDADLLYPCETKKEELEIEGLNLIRRPHLAIKDTIHYYNAKSILGEIDCLVITYKMKGYDEIYFDCYINDNLKLINVVAPINIVRPPDFSISNDIAKNINFPKLFFKDFKLIK